MTHKGIGIDKLAQGKNYLIEYGNDKGEAPRIIYAKFIYYREKPDKFYFNLDDTNVVISIHVTDFIEVEEISNTE